LSFINSFDAVVCFALVVAVVLGFNSGLLRSAVTILAYLFAMPIAIWATPLEIATGIVVPAHGSAVVTPAVARASAGAVEHIPIAVVTNLARYLEEVKGGAFWVYGASGEPAAQSMWETDLTGGVAIVLGAEGKGLRPLVKRMCDALVSIPLAGEIESLNVSVAAAGAAVRSASATGG